jgi:hypothetical protein
MHILNKKNITITQLVILLLTGIMFDSCKKNNYSVDLDSPKEAPEFAQFAPADRRQSRYYPLLENNAPFKIPIGFTNISNEDREIKLSYTSKRAVIGTDYTSAPSILIPAGKALDSLVFTGIYNQYPIGRRDTVVIKITDRKAVDRKDTFEIILERYCDVILAQLGGEFARTREFRSNGTYSYGPYSTFVDNLTATGPTRAEGFFVNLYDEGWNDIKFIMDWSDPANFSITVPRQATGKTGSSDVQFVRTSASGVNTFSSCTSTFTVSLDLLGGNNDNVLSTGYQFRLVR